MNSISMALQISSAVLPLASRHYYVFSTLRCISQLECLNPQDEHVTCSEARAGLPKSSSVPQHEDLQAKARFPHLPAGSQPWPHTFSQPRASTTHDDYLCFAYTFAGY